MSKRPGLSSLKMATDARNRGGVDVKTAPKNGSELATIRLPKQTYDLLRSVALRRAAAGARFSLSRVITDLAERHRDELEREARA